MKTLIKIYYRIFKRYRRLDYRVTSYREADALIRDTSRLSYEQQWHIAPEEDANKAFNIVHLERRERITQ